LASFDSPGGAKLGVDDGSGDVMPPADRVTEDFVDKSDSGFLPSDAESDAKSEPHRTHMMPHASIVLPKQSSSLRMFDLLYYQSDQSIL